MNGESPHICAGARAQCHIVSTVIFFQASGKQSRLKHTPLMVICRVADGTSPDVVLLSLGLWDMLHITSVESFSHDMGPLQQAADAFVASKKGKHSGVDKVHIYRSLETCNGVTNHSPLPIF
jgi:hypothetical protein